MNKADLTEALAARANIRRCAANYINLSWAPSNILVTGEKVTVSDFNRCRVPNAVSSLVTTPKRFKSVSCIKSSVRTGKGLKNLEHRARHIWEWRARRGEQPPCRALFATTPAPQVRTKLFTSLGQLHTISRFQLYSARIRVCVQQIDSHFCRNGDSQGELFPQRCTCSADGTNHDSTLQTTIPL